MAFVETLSMQTPSISETPAAMPGPIPLLYWGRQRNLSPTTLWRYRKNGWLVTINIAGRPYLTPTAIQDFEERAVAGEFSRPPRGAAAGKRLLVSAASPKTATE